MLNIPGMEFEADDPGESQAAITANGHDYFEALSALQKSVRRGLEEDALYWANELYQFNATALWNRLKVFASEEIALASPGTVLLIRALYENCQGQKNPGESRLFLAHAVCALCRAKKNATVHCAAIIMRDLPKREIPDYALDKHTKRGKTKGRGMQHFFDVGILQNNVDESIPNIYLDRARKAKGVK
ncbi:MAG: hypothetical protein WAM96_07675 [Candidatus Acidiferrales bacterium]